MLTLQGGRKFEDRILIHKGEWFCPYCRFRRTFATVKGALEGAGRHLMAQHLIRLTLPSKAKEEPS